MYYKAGVWSGPNLNTCWRICDTVGTPLASGNPPGLFPGINLYPLFNDQNVFVTGAGWYYPDQNLLFDIASNSIQPYAGVPVGGVWQFRYSYDNLPTNAAGYLVHVFVSAGTPIWNATYSSVVIPAGIYYQWHVKQTDAYLGQFIMHYTETVTTNAACAAIVGARCSDWMTFYPNNNTIAGVPPPLAYRNGCTCTVTVTAQDEMQDSTTQSFTISLSNTNPSCKPLPTVCIYIGQYFLVDMDKYCSDPEG